MKYKPNKQELSCTVCGVDTPETIDGVPLCFDCICQIQERDDDIKNRVDKSDFDPIDKTILGIVEKVQEYTGIKDITIKSRKREICEARQIAHYVAIKLKCGSLAVVGWQIGRKDHSTCLHSCSTVEKLKGDKLFMEKYGDLIKYYEKEEQDV